VLLAAPAAAAAPIDAYGGLPSIESVEISPDGSKLAVAISTGEQRVIGIKPMPMARCRPTPWARRRCGVSTGSAPIADHHHLADRPIIDVEAPRREYLLGFDLNVATRKLHRSSTAAGPADTGTHFRDNGRQTR
jgi:hypothetical protein